MVSSWQTAATAVVNIATRMTQRETLANVISVFISTLQMGLLYTSRAGVRQPFAGCELHLHPRECGAESCPKQLKGPRQPRVQELLNETLMPDQHGNVWAGASPRRVLLFFREHENGRSPDGQ